MAALDEESLADAVLFEAVLHLKNKKQQAQNKAIVNVLVFI